MLLWQLILDGGPVMWVLLGCSVLALAIFLSKLMQFHRDRINSEELVKGLLNVLRRDGFVEAISLCDNTPGPVAKVLGAAIIAYERGDEDIRAAVDDAALEEIPKLERSLNVLSTIGYIAPLLGLLGTVLGMMQAFRAINLMQGASLTATELAGAINMALITTAGGLVVAIPCYVAYNYLLGKANVLALDIERSAAEVIYFFGRHERGGDKAKKA